MPLADFIKRLPVPLILSHFAKKSKLEQACTDFADCTLEAISEERGERAAGIEPAWPAWKAGENTSEMSQSYCPTLGKSSCLSKSVEGKENYPLTPGAKVYGTSSDAATAISPIAKNLRQSCLAWLTFPMTADEVARVLEMSILAIRPRISELSRMGLIEDSGFRRRNASGKRAIVWRAK